MLLQFITRIPGNIKIFMFDVLRMKFWKNTTNTGCISYINLRYH